MCMVLIGISNTVSHCLIVGWPNSKNGATAGCMEAPSWDICFILGLSVPTRSSESSGTEQSRSPSCPGSSPCPHPASCPHQCWLGLLECQPALQVAQMFSSKLCWPIDGGPSSPGASGLPYGTFATSITSATCVLPALKNSGLDSDRQILTPN